MPIVAFGATLGFSPASGSYQPGSVLTVNVYANSGGTALNALSGVVSYPKDLLEVISVSKGQSIISLWVQEPSFSNTAGTVNFEGIVLNPGYNGTNGKVLTINFKVKSAGTANLSFSSGSILANDGEGSEIISGKGTAQFTVAPVTVIEEEVVDAPKVVQEEKEKEENNLIPNITSETHPKDVWSAKKDGVFNFILTEDVTAVRLLADDVPDSIPTNIYTPPITTKDVKDLPEGVSYLHIQYRNKQGWGEVLDYKIQVDTQPPQNFIIKELGSNIFYFEANDVLSGVSNYETQIDGGEVFKYTDDGSHIYKAPELNSGNHTLYVKAYDVAGNYTISTLVFSIAEGAQKGDITTAPTDNSVLNKGAELITVLSIVIPFLSLILLLILLLYLAWRSLWGMRKRVDKEVMEAKIIVHKAFTLLHDDLEEDIETLKKANTKRKLTREESKILKRLQKNIEEAERVIGKEVEDIEKEIH